MPEITNGLTAFAEEPASLLWRSHDLDHDELHSDRIVSRLLRNRLNLQFISGALVDACQKSLLDYDLTGEHFFDQPRLNDAFSQLLGEYEVAWDLHDACLLALRRLELEVYHVVLVWKHFAACAGREYLVPVAVLTEDILRFRDARTSDPHAVAGFDQLAAEYALVASSGQILDQNSLLEGVLTLQVERGDDLAVDVERIEVLDALPIFALAGQASARVVLVDLREEVLGPLAQLGQLGDLRGVECVAAERQTGEGEWLADVVQCRDGVLRQVGRLQDDVCGVGLFRPMEDGPFALARVHVDVELPLAAIRLAVRPLHADDVADLAQVGQVRPLARVEGDQRVRVDDQLRRVSRHEFARLVLDLHGRSLVQGVVDDLEVQHPDVVLAVGRRNLRDDPVDVDRLVAIRLRRAQLLVVQALLDDDWLFHHSR